MVKLTRSEAGKLGKEKSRKVQEQQYSDRIEKYLEAPNFCKHCKMPLDYKHRHNVFCTSSCAANHNNQVRVIRKACIRCGIEIGKGSKKYCSVECQKLFNAEQAINAGIASWTTIRGYLLKTNRKCSDCGLAEWKQKPIPLEIHHVDGDSNNNAFNNLVLICPNCHALTPTYKARNKGNGRAYRRERYKEGKSF